MPLKFWTYYFGVFATSSRLRKPEGKRPFGRLWLAWDDNTL